MVDIIMKKTFGNKHVYISGVWIDNLTALDAVEMIKSRIAERIPSYIVTPNADHIVRLQRDPEFREAYKNASLTIADGMPILWAAKFLGTPLKEKISGSDLFPKICAVAAKQGYKLFFLGGRRGAAIGAAEVLKIKYPNIQIVGTYSPPVGFEKDAEEDNKIATMIKASNPDILFVGLGAPKQEKWIFSHYTRLGVPVSIGIGAAFEFISGIVKRAPVWMQKIGLEWFWRLIMEPRRLWKRYLIDDMNFFWLVLKGKISGNRRKAGRDA